MMWSPKKDADRIRKNLSKEKGLVPEDLVVGVAVGGCPHTAVREDPSMNLSVVEEMESHHGELDLILIESGGDNITTTFSPRFGRLLHLHNRCGGRRQISK